MILVGIKVRLKVEGILAKVRAGGAGVKAGATAAKKTTASLFEGLFKAPKIDVDPVSWQGAILLRKLKKTEKVPNYEDFNSLWKQLLAKIQSQPKELIIVNKQFPEQGQSSITWSAKVDDTSFLMRLAFELTAAGPLAKELFLMKGQLASAEGLQTFRIIDFEDSELKAKHPQLLFAIDSLLTKALGKPA